MAVALLLIDASSSDPVIKEAASSMALGLPTLVLLVVGASKRDGKRKKKKKKKKKKILAAWAMLSGS
jgi:hypothetical protein